MAKSNLVIVESPAKAKTIGKYLGPDYQVKASMGHVRDLPKSKIGVDVEHGFVPDYQPIKGKEEVISDLKKAAKALGEKKVEMLHVKDLKAVTGYIRGGCSPIGMKKAYPVFLDESCAKLPRICISAGVRGCMLELDPAALCAALGFGRLPLTKDEGQAEKEPMQAYER